MTATEFLQKYPKGTTSEDEILERWEQHAKDCEGLFITKKWINETTDADFYESCFKLIYDVFSKQGERLERLKFAESVGDLKKRVGELYPYSNNAAEVKYFKGCLNLLREIETRHKELFCEFMLNMGFEKNPHRKGTYFQHKRGW